MDESFVGDLDGRVIARWSDEQVRTRLCGLAARIDVATAQLLALVGEVDAREAWGGPGIKSCAHWLSWQCGIGTVAARAQVRVARALRTLPLIRAEFDAGRLSYAKVRAITRIAEPENEQDLVELARAATAAQLERTVRAWRRVDTLAAEEEQRRREVRWHWDDDGMLVFRARLSAEEGAVLISALESIRIEPQPEDEPEPGNAGNAGNADEAIPRNRLAPVPSPRPDALIGIARAFLDPDGADVDRDPRAQVVVHIDSRVLAEDARGGLAAYENGGAVSSAAARRLTCDCTLVAMLRDGGDVLDVGRPHRRIPRAIRRALTARDAGCVFPSCTERRVSRLHAHHVRHWADGGPTVLANLISLCRYHHRCVHEEGYEVRATSTADHFAFSTPQTVPLDRLPASPPADSAPELPDVDVSTIPRWGGEPLELDFVISVLRDRRNLRRQTRHRLGQAA